MMPHPYEYYLEQNDGNYYDNGDAHMAAVLSGGDTKR
jgi:hypothetical protein